MIKIPESPPGTRKSRIPCAITSGATTVSSSPMLVRPAREETFPSFRQWADPPPAPIRSCATMHRKSNVDTVRRSVPHQTISPPKPESDAVAVQTILKPQLTESEIDLISSTSSGPTINSTTKNNLLLLSSSLSDLKGGDVAELQFISPPDYIELVSDQVVQKFRLNIINGSKPEYEIISYEHKMSQTSFKEITKEEDGDEEELIVKDDALREEHTVENDAETELYNECNCEVNDSKIDLYKLFEEKIVICPGNNSFKSFISQKLKINKLKECGNWIVVFVLLGILLSSIFWYGFPLAFQYSIKMYKLYIYEKPEPVGLLQNLNNIFHDAAIFVSDFIYKCLTTPATRFYLSV